MFKALKGWNFQTEEFETIEDYFNPSKNTNWGLSSIVNLKQLVTGLNKVLPRAFVKDVMLREYTNSWAHSPWVVEFITRLFDSDDLSTLMLLNMTVQQYDYNEDTGRDGPCLGINLRQPYIHRGQLGFQNTRTFINLPDWDEDEGYEITDEIVQQAVAWMKQKWTASTNIEDHPEPTSFVIDASRNITFSSPSLNAYWRQHFARNTYYSCYRAGVQTLPGDSENVGISTVAGGFRDGHKIEVLYWAKNCFDAPRFIWVMVRDLNDRSFLYRVQNYTTDVTQLLPGPLREKNEISHNLYGIELEVASSVEPKTIIEAPEAIYCALKQDSTVSGNKQYKYEIVSTPATPKAHKKAWAQILEKVGYNAFDVTRNTTNGMHIHVDLNAFKNKDGIHDSLHQKQFCWFFCNPVNLSFHQQISERDEDSFYQYTPLPSFGNTMPLSHHYKSVLTTILPPFRGIVHFKESRATGQFVTLEVRLFKGIVSLASICKNIEYVDSVFNFTTKCCFQSNTIGNYLAYLKATPANRYTTLKEFLKRLDLEVTAEETRLRHLVWGQQDAEKVKRLIQHSSIKITPSHIEILNNLMQGAKFALKQGELTVVQTNRSRIHDLDLMLQAKLNRPRRQQACA